MEELLMLKDLLLKGDVPAALVIVEELEEMSKQEIIDNIRSYAVILLLHLIKQQAEKRTTRSWEVSIRNSVREIKIKNKRRKAGGYYLSPEEGRYLPEELEQLVNREDLLDRAMALILPQE